MAEFSTNEKKLRTVFESLNLDDFKKDAFMENFYNLHKKNKNNLFDNYINYITRNLENNEIMRNKNIENTKEKIWKDIIKLSEDNDKKTIKITKSNIIVVLSDYIKHSFIISEDPSKEQDDNTVLEEMHNINTTFIAKEISTNYGNEKLKSKPDTDYKQKIDIVNLIKETKNKCKKFKQSKPEPAKIIEKCFYIDCSTITSISPNYNFSNINLDFKLCSDSEEVIIDRNFKNNFNKIKEDLNPNKFKVVHNNALNQSIMNKKNNKKSLYICSGNQIVYGGNANRGEKTTETKLMLMSTYTLSMDTCNDYPLSNYKLLFLQNVVIFKNNQLEDLETEKWVSIPILISPTVILPQTNINDPSNDHMDRRLFNNNIFYISNTSLYYLSLA